MQTFSQSWRWQRFRAIISLLFLAFLVSSCGGNVDRHEAGDEVIASNRLLPGNIFTAQSIEVTTGTGTAGAIGALIADPATGRVKAGIIVSGVAATSVALAQSAGTSSAPVAFELAETAPGSGIWTGEAIFSSTQLSELNAGRVQFQARSAAVPAGELHAQFLQQLPPETAVATGLAAERIVLTNVLTGSQQAPPNSNNATSIGIAVADTSARTLGVVVVSSGIAGTEAHIHEAMPGKNGPAIFALAQTAANSGIWFTQTRLSDGQLDSIAGGRYYFDIHSVSLPGGEVRGQIVDLNQEAFDDCGSCFHDGHDSGIGLTIGFGFGFGNVGAFFFSDTGVQGSTPMD